MMRNLNVNVNNAFCFTLSYELFGWPTIAKYQAFETFYCTYADTVEGVVVEGGIVIWGGEKTKGEVQKCEITNEMFLLSYLLT